MAARQAEQFIDALHQLEEGGELDPMVEMFSDDAELQNPTDGEPHRGRQGAQAFWEEHRDGRIRRFRAYFDPSGLGDQLTDGMR